MLFFVIVFGLFIYWIYLFEADYSGKFVNELAFADLTDNLKTEE